MISLPSSIIDAINRMKKLSGVGEKTSTRYVLDFLNWKEDELVQLINALEQLKDLNKCESCGFYSEEKLCEICSSEERVNQKSLCVVENISDCLAIEKSRVFKGTYFILSGVLNPMLGIGPAELSLDKIKNKVRENNIQNVILAINPSVEGDATCSYIKSLLEDFKINVERIGFGIPMGGSLEYMDSMTISQALENRRIY